MSKRRNLEAWECLEAFLGKRKAGMADYTPVKKNESKHGGINCRTRLVERSYWGYMPPPFSDQNEVVDSKGWAVLMFASTTCRPRYPTSALSLEAIRHAVSGNAPAKFSSKVVNTPCFTREKSLYNGPSLEAIRHRSFWECSC